MVYESDFYTRRAYTRPSVSSYTVSYPYYRYLPSVTSYPYYRYLPSVTSYPYYRYLTSITSYPYYRYYPSIISYPYYRYTPTITSYPTYSYSSYITRYPIYRYTPTVSRVYSYPIYPYHSIPYVAHKRLITGTRIISSPVRETSPIRVIRTTRVVRSTTPVRYITPLRDISPVRSYSSVRVIYSPPRYTRESSVDVLSSIPSFRTPRSVYARELDRIANKVRARVGYSALEDYLSSGAFINFDSEARRIRSSAQSLLREIHTPVFRRARSATPFPVTRYETPNYALKAYVSRVTDPLHNIASDVNSLLNTYSDQRRYPGKSHLASVRILGNRGYNIRNTLYDPDVVKTDIEYLSHYLKNRQAAKEKSPQLVRHLSVDAVEAKEVPASG